MTWTGNTEKFTCGCEGEGVGGETGEVSREPIVKGLCAMLRSLSVILGVAGSQMRLLNGGMTWSDVFIEKWAPLIV